MPGPQRHRRARRTGCALCGGQRHRCLMICERAGRKPVVDRAQSYAGQRLMRIPEKARSLIFLPTCFIHGSFCRLTKSGPRIILHFTRSLITCISRKTPSVSKNYGHTCFRYVPASAKRPVLKKDRIACSLFFFSGLPSALAAASASMLAPARCANPVRLAAHLSGRAQRRARPGLKAAIAVKPGMLLEQTRFKSHSLCSLPLAAYLAGFENSAPGRPWERFSRPRL